MPTPAIIPDAVFEFSQVEIGLFVLSALIVLVTSIVSGRTVVKSLRRAARLREGANAAAARSQRVAVEQSLAAAKKGELDEMDVEFDDFFDDEVASPHDPIDYLVPGHLRNDPDAMEDEEFGNFMLMGERLKRQHSVFGVPIDKAQQQVRRRVEASADLRLDRIERSMRLRSEALATMGGLSGTELTRGLVSETSGVDRMHTTPQVQPVDDLLELPWLSAAEVELIHGAQALERRAMIEGSGRDPDKALSERTTLDLTLDVHHSPPADNMTSISRAFKKASPNDNRSSVTESVLRTAHRVGDLASNASFLVSGRQRSGTLNQRVMLNALDAASDLGSSNGSFYGHRSASSLQGAVQGRTQDTPTWVDLGRKSGNAALYQFSSSPSERLRNVRTRVDVGPLRPGDGFRSGNVVAPLATAEMQLTAQYLPDPDEDTFVGIDLDYRLLDADL